MFERVIQLVLLSLFAMMFSIALAALYYFAVVERRKLDSIHSSASSDRRETLLDALSRAEQSTSEANVAMPVVVMAMVQMESATIQLGTADVLQMIGLESGQHLEVS